MEISISRFGARERAARGGGVMRGEAGSGVQERERLEVGGLCEEGVAWGGWDGLGWLGRSWDGEKERDQRQ